MVDINEVLNTAGKAADEIVSNLYDFGHESLGGGLHRIAEEKLIEGYGDCLNNACPIAYDIGRRDGISEGALKGGIATLAVLGGLYVVSKIVNRIKLKIEQKKDTEEAIIEEEKVYEA